jgi:hypothetical protein
MPFVKLDCGLLDSTLWFEREAREVFITALLMAEPFEVREELEAFNIRELTTSGFVVPPGWYGFVSAAGPGIVNRAQLDLETGLSGLEKLSEPDPGSRTPDFEGRRMVRVNGGFIILNYQKYRERDYTNAERQARWRARQKDKNNGVTSHSNTVMSRCVTQAEVEAEAEVELSQKKKSRRFTPPSLEEVKQYCQERGNQVDPESFVAFYESKGWMIGKNKMKSWKSAVITWEKRGNSDGNKRQESKSAVDRVRAANQSGAREPDNTGSH